MSDVVDTETTERRGLSRHSVWVESIEKHQGNAQVRVHAKGPEAEVTFVVRRPVADGIKIDQRLTITVASR